MSTAFAPPPTVGLTPQWQDWLTSSIVQGRPDPELVTAMREAGFDEQFARIAVGIVRSMADRVRREAPVMLTQYQADPIRIKANAGTVRAADRDVGIGFSLINPNVALLVDLLSEQECDKLIQLSSGKLQRSEVVDRASGGSSVSEVRTSRGTYFERGENAVISRIEKRIEALTGIPVECGEPLQILHYQVAGRYEPHHDYFDPADPGTAKLVETGGQRVATVVIYLNDVPEGGDTVFPELELSVRARRGSAVYFEYSNQAGELDPRCLHGGAPVTGGQKWIATKWLRQQPYVRAG